MDEISQIFISLDTHHVSSALHIVVTNLYCNIDLSILALVLVCGLVQ
jgi:hypothetical protein